MREIKFRAWDRLANQMSPEFVLFGEFTLLGAIHDWQWEVLQKSPRDASQYNSLGRLNDLEIMQFTGFYDKKGVEVYEGDIFRVEEDGAEDGTDMIYYLVIVWIKEWGMFGTLRVGDEYPKYLIEGAKALDEPMFWTYTLEDTNDRRFYLAGNIYQNPELLNSTEIKSSYQHPKL